MKRASVALPIVLALVLLLPADALAGSVSKRDAGGVSKRIAKRFGLTRAERAALDIARIQASGKEGLGVVVEVTFKGNAERRLGRGHLKRAGVAVILRPKSSRVRSTVLATAGAGLKQRLLIRSRSKKVGAVRDGRKLTFFLRGSGFSGVKDIDVKSFASLPKAKRRARSAALLPDSRAEEIAASDLQADLADLEDELDDIDLERLSCAELRELDADLDELAGELRQLQLDLAKGRRGLEREAKRAADDPERFADLVEAIDELKSLEKQLRFTREALEELRDEIALELRGCGPITEALSAIFAWRLFDPTEVFVPDARFVVRPGPAQAADVRSPITAVRVVVPRRITNFLCPSQLPNGQLSNTDATEDTLTCTGGSLAVDQTFQMNLRTTPNPSAGMGGKVFGQQDAAFKGPFGISGP